MGLSILNLYFLDHFVPKAAFPLFSLSLYNLVPVCRSCNSTFKCESFLPIPSPISDNGNDSPFFNFEYNTLSALVGMSTDLQIRSDQSTFENFLLNELFLLEEQYEFHKKDVQNFNRRKVLINSAYKKGYKKNFSTTPYSDDDIDRIIFGFPSDDSEIFEKPLSKLHLDLLRSNPTL